MIRAYVSGDHRAVKDLWSACELSPIEEVELAALTARDGNSAHVAVTDNAVVGFVLGTYDGRRGWIHRLAVHPDARGLGIGSGLVAALESALGVGGAVRVNLLVLPENERALRFWRRRGYEPRPDVLHTKGLDASGPPTANNQSTAGMN